MAARSTTAPSSSPLPVRGDSKLSLGLLGDESLEFWRGPLQYVERRKEDYGEVFLGRLLNKPTIFLTGSSSVNQLLNEKWKCFGLGYKEYMFDLFGENLLFQDDDTWERARESLKSVFDHQNMSQSLETMKQLISEHIKGTPQNSSIAIYSHFKSLATNLSISLFLSPSLGKDEVKEISDLMTTHWHGIISLPVSFKVPLMQWKSGFGKALAAKERLLEIIRAKLKSEPSEIAAGVERSCDTTEHCLNNILLFVTALIPKALASLMTSIVLELSKPDNKEYCECIHNQSLLEDVILECQRLWPPFFGGRRICTQKCIINGHVIPEGHAVAYMSHTANRDNKVFHNPNQFKPERWRNENVNDRDLVWTFGGGPRCCIGKHLIQLILKEWLSQLLSTLKWNILDNVGQYKLLPVCRPSNDVLGTFTLISPTAQ